MTKTIITGLFILQICLINIFGQTANQPPDEPGCATEEGKILSFLAGSWKVKSKFRTGSNPDRWEETAGTSKIKFLFDRCLVQEELKIKRGGRPLTVIALYSYNNLSKNYQYIFAHSEHGVLTLFEGPFDETKFTLKNSVEVRGQTVYFERLLTKNSKGFELVAKRSSDEGKTWRDDWFLTYYR